MRLTSSFAEKKEKCGLIWSARYKHLAVSLPQFCCLAFS